MQLYGKHIVGVKLDEIHVFERKRVNGVGENALFIVPEHDIALAALREFAVELPIQ